MLPTPIPRAGRSACLRHRLEFDESGSVARWEGLGLGAGVALAMM